MPNAYFTIAKPANDPFKSYLPGSPERAELKAELARQSAQVVKIPLIIGGKEVWTDKTISPRDAVSLGAKILVDHFTLFTDLSDTVGNRSTVVEKVEAQRDKVLELSLIHI